ncbi:SAM-dependent methyltransferase [Spirillospora sp. CA-128828]|uniref:SAM-dependent methyltransferase n=1 Tax=Spirillospora sp. CA-128828 TaxID=3240033 RepID=UPI003D8AD3E1
MPVGKDRGSIRRVPPDRDIDVTRPSPARVYGYLLGGTDNYAIDRQTAEHVLPQTPEARRSAMENRRFLIRAVEYLCDQGVRRFPDLGSGLPTPANVHEVAQRAGNGTSACGVRGPRPQHPHAREGASWGAGPHRVRAR